MSHGRPPAEVRIDAALVRQLLTEQFPQWAGLELTEVTSAGWDNTIYRLGRDLAVRLPRRQIAAGLAEREHQWLPLLGPRLPLAVPVPVGHGVPGAGYPWRWTVCRWLAGGTAAEAPVRDSTRAALRLAEFIAALQAIDPVGGPVNEFRGTSLQARDPVVRATVAALRGRLDPGPVLSVWEAALSAPAWDGTPVWMHGDLHPANLLVDHGELTAVIDFGLLGVGDPACDLMAAWTFLAGEARGAFRAALQAPEPMWSRARGWALQLGLMSAAYSSDNPALDQIGWRTVHEVVAEALP